MARVDRIARGTRRLLDIPLREVGDLVVAQVELIRARLRLATAGKGSLLRRIEGAVTPSTEDHRRLDRIAKAVDRAADFGLFPATCLVRAVAMERMIARHPEDAGAAVVRVGVRPTNEGIAAHAWIASGNRVFGDSPEHVASFVPLQDFSGLRG